MDGCVCPADGFLLSTPGIFSDRRKDEAVITEEVVLDRLGKRQSRLFNDWPASTFEQSQGLRK